MNRKKKHTYKRRREGREGGREGVDPLNNGQVQSSR